MLCLCSTSPFRPPAQTNAILPFAALLVRRGGAGRRGVRGVRARVCVVFAYSQRIVSEILAQKVCKSLDIMRLDAERKLLQRDLIIV